MITNIWWTQNNKNILFSKNDTAGKEILSMKAKEFETISYIYIITDNGVLHGIVSLKQVLVASVYKTWRVDDHCNVLVWQCGLGLH